MKGRVILLGPPGSGKGTIAIKLQSEFKLKHISSGSLLRQEVKMGSPLGQQVQSFIDNGQLAPDTIVLDYMRRWLNADLVKQGFLLDGFPRSIPQAIGLDEYLSNLRAPIELVLLCECNEAIILERITGRRTCSGCGKIYHVEAMPPQVEGKCDACGCPLILREDDRPEVVRRRLEVYARTTEPLINFYRNQNKLAPIDASLGSEFGASAAALAVSAD